MKDAQPIPAHSSGERIGRRAHVTAAGLSVADLRDRLAEEALRRADPIAVPLVAGAPAAGALSPPAVPTPAAQDSTSERASGDRPARHTPPEQASGQPLAAKPMEPAGGLGRPVAGLAEPVTGPRPVPASRRSADRPTASQTISAPVAPAACAAAAPLAAAPSAVAVAAKPAAVPAGPVIAAAVRPLPSPPPVAPPVLEAVTAEAVAGPSVAAPDDLTEPVAAPVVTVITRRHERLDGPAARPGGGAAPEGRRRISRSGAPTVFRVPPAPAPTPGSRVAAAHRRATAASRRRPLLLSTPVLIVAALIAGGSIGAERLRSVGADTSAVSPSSADGTTRLGQSDARVSRDKRTATTAPSSEAAPGPADTTAAAEPLVDSAQPAPATDPVLPPVAAGGESAATPEATVTADAPPPSATWVHPVEGGTVTSCFCTRWGAFHDGIDIALPLGTPITSVGDGTVTFAGPLSGYGIGIYIQHLDGSVSFYGHMAIYSIKTGDVVTAGQEIALVGNEGISTGPHLHFGVFAGSNASGLRGSAVDPIPWLADRGVTVGPYNPNG